VTFAQRGAVRGQPLPRLLPRSPPGRDPRTPSPRRSGQPEQQAGNRADADPLHTGELTQQLFSLWERKAGPWTPDLPAESSPVFKIRC